MRASPLPNGYSMTLKTAAADTKAYQASASLSSTFQPSGTSRLAPNPRLPSLLDLTNAADLPHHMSSHLQRSCGLKSLSTCIADITTNTNPSPPLQPILAAPCPYNTAAARKRKCAVAPSASPPRPLRPTSQVILFLPDNTATEPSA